MFPLVVLKIAFGSGSSVCVSLVTVLSCVSILTSVSGAALHSLGRGVPWAQAAMQEQSWAGGGGHALHLT